MVSKDYALGNPATQEVSAPQLENRNDYTVKSTSILCNADASLAPTRFCDSGNRSHHCSENCGCLLDR